MSCAVRAIRTAACGFANEAPLDIKILPVGGPSLAKPQAALTET
jgi:hypothetical protein